MVRTSTETDTIEYVWTSYLRINGVYWGLSAMSLLGYDVKKDMAVPGSEIADWIMSCQVRLLSPYLYGYFYVKGLERHAVEELEFYCRASKNEKDKGAPSLLMHVWEWVLGILNRYILLK